MDLDERPRVEFPQLVDLARLGQRVPVMLQAAGVGDEREVVVGQFGGRQMGARVEARPAARGGKPQVPNISSAEP
jgi:hypothetical protein